MTDVVIYGIPQSTYVRSARMACIEKGVPHTLEPHMPQSDAMRGLHPFGKVPAMRHGDFTLYETSAIMRYVDEAFDGPPLAPKEPRRRAQMEQWISSINCYFDGPMIRRLVIGYAFPQTPDGKPDRALIDAAAPEVGRQIKMIDAALAEGPFLFGAAPTLADLLLAPIMFYVSRTPEGEAMMKDAPNIQRAGAAMRSRKSFEETMPPPPPKRG
jgi:glutathione S-transferase